MRSFDSRKAIHARVQARQEPVPVVAPRQEASVTVPFEISFSMPTATNLIIDTSVMTFAPPPTAILRAPPTSSSTPLIESSLSSSSSVSTATAEASADSTPLVLDPAQRVYDGIANSALHSLPPAVIGIASGGSALIVLLALYCYICRWYYRRLPRSTARWDVDDRAKKEAVYGDKPQYSPRDDEPPHSVEADRRTVPVGDSYFPEGETWQKFDGRTANHPESFIYTGNGLPEGMGPGSPDSPGSNGPSPRSGVPLARPRPQFANPRRAQVESVFSNVSFPTTHRADSIRHSFFPEGYEHEGEVWDLASPSFANEGARPSFESTTVNRASIFGEASARARGSVVIYESHPIRPPTIVDDPFAAPADLPSPAKERFASKKSLDAPGKRSYDAAKRSVDGGKKSFEAYSMQVRSRDARAAALDTLAEDADETSAQGHGTISSARAK
ncbi:hypothetical protein RhiTH_005711 [Rhizoctonia solani]|uniref:Transmembrane protein n=1 Tax=Rhizoctonia solani TaxID=456999 RepID=A0A8H7HBY3_9AGAM|nr:hypothetical protein RHS04_01841 [Rhizoctonia solani]